MSSEHLWWAPSRRVGESVLFWLLIVLIVMGISLPIIAHVFFNDTNLWQAFCIGTSLISVGFFSWATYKRYEADERLRQAAEFFSHRADEEHADKDRAYHERNVVVAALARLFPSGIRATDIEGWNPEWQNCVYIDLPTGQVSYHYHISEEDLFVNLPPYEKPYDGHDKRMVHERLGHVFASPDGYVSLSWIENWFAYRLALVRSAWDLTGPDTEGMWKLIGEELQKDIKAFLGK